MKMKRTMVLIGILMVMFISVAIAANNKQEYTTLTELETKTLNKTEAMKIMGNYGNKLPGATAISSYKTDDTHVIIEFKGTDYRVITSKKKFDSLIE